MRPAVYEAMELLKVDRAVLTASPGRTSMPKIIDRSVCAYLRHHSPVAQIGYSIFVFDLTDDEINHALYGAAPRS
jgi:hypothetical protein